MATHVYTLLSISASGAASGQGYSTYNAQRLGITVNVSIPGTSGTLDLEWSFDGGSTWVTSAAEDSRAIAAADLAYNVAVKAPLVRANFHTVTGVYTMQVDAVLLGRTN